MKRSAAACSQALQLTPVIMAGGTGTRLWPMSRQLFPKQFQPIHPDGSTPFQAALQLAEDVSSGGSIHVVTGAEQRFLAAEQVRHAGIKSRIWAEPCRCSTAAVVALAADTAASGDEILLMMPADHYIADRQGAREALAQGAALAAQGRLVLFGVPPLKPETGFGYIETVGEQQSSGRQVACFHEKPDIATAEMFHLSGRHLWNSGLFMARADTFLAEFEALAPEILAAVRRASPGVRQEYSFEMLPEDEWRQVPDASFDKAVAEKSSILTVVDFQVGWNDLGTFEALWQVGTPDENNNVTQGKVQAMDSSGNLLRASDKRLLAVMGVHGMAVIDTGDVVLVAPRAAGQKMRAMVGEIGSNGNADLLNRHERVYRPWGSYVELDIGEKHLCKRIIVHPGEELSLQYHKHRAEHWVVVRGQAEVTLGTETRVVRENESVYVPQGAHHSLRNASGEDLEVIEVQTGDSLSEQDIIRVEDKYLRNRDNEGGEPSESAQLAAEKSG